MKTTKRTVSPKVEAATVEQLNNQTAQDIIDAALRAKDEANSKKETAEQLKAHLTANKEQRAEQRHTIALSNHSRATKWESRKEAKFQAERAFSLAQALNSKPEEREAAVVDVALEYGLADYDLLEVNKKINSARSSAKSFLNSLLSI